MKSIKYSELITITSDDDLVGITCNPRKIEGIECLKYADGGYTYFPEKGFFRSWQDKETESGILTIGRCSAFGKGSYIKFDSVQKHVKIGRYVNAGLRVKIISGGAHETQYAAMCPFHTYDPEMKSHLNMVNEDITIKNDVWIGDEAMILSGSTIENGCVIGARSLVTKSLKTEPYGIYAGNPARLIRFRFPDLIRYKLLEIAWWNKPFSWVKKNNNLFMEPVTKELLARFENA